MWNRREGEAQPQAPAHSKTTHAATHTQAPPVPTPPAPRQPVPPTASGMVNVIGAAISVIGDIRSEEDLLVDGEVQGTLDIRNSRLTIGPKAKAKSNIRAREVIIQGQVQGDVDASQKIVIRREGSLVGNIKTTGIVIDDDAYFKGSIDIVRKTEAGKENAH